MGVPILAPFFSCLPPNENFGPLESKPLLKIINLSIPSRARVRPTVETKCLVSKEVDKEVNKVEVVMDEVVDK
jgi:hypothetical protein